LIEIAGARTRFPGQGPSGRSGGIIEIDCPYCGAREGRSRWADENGFTAWRCANCRFVYVSPRPDDQERSEAIRLGQHSGNLNTSEARSEKKVRIYRQRLGALLGRVDAPVRWLDVGAGNGEVMEALAALLPPGSEVFGVEPSDEKRANAPARLKPRMVASLDDAPDEMTHISLINVFSHVSDFRGFLAVLARHGTPGHEIIVETGNGADMSVEEYHDHLYLPDHLTFCGVAHLRGFLGERYELIGEAGYRVDTALQFAKDLVKPLLGRRAKAVIPYSSPFRTIFVRGRALAAT
jgi:SAM-dependent methyltransferase